VFLIISFCIAKLVACHEISYASLQSVMKLTLSREARGYSACGDISGYFQESSNEQRLYQCGSYS
ncbi:hypothetical protein, partial [Erwinia amylovora]|uniref:hypothetical protein n=1 Tax=Erwinia amylovora TaxID=552 RepID=UPI0019659AF2